ncbi:FG-GAP repeat domain-containing protein [Plantactinospora sonchi]|uniref:VCBS repeat-containing protein n=1 Tax=Plantactinospora sonchi TaxID=1544735 RepID=A0ABU7RMW5_9ACTN
MERNGALRTTTLFVAVMLAAVTTTTAAPAQAASTIAFQPARYIATGHSGTDSLAVADVTGDSRPDIVVGVGAAHNGETSSLLVYAQQPDRTYGSPRRIVGHGGYGGEVRVAVGDIDGDGRTDAALSTPGGIDVFYQRSNQLAAPLLVGIGAEDVALTDMTGDGRLDIVAAVTHGTVLIYPQNGSSTFGAATTVSGPADSGVPRTQVFTADLNGDSRPDVAQFYGKGTWVRLQQAGGAFGPATTHLIAPDADGYRWPSGGAAVGDLTGDGRSDLMMTAEANISHSAVNVFAQRGGALAVTPVTYPAYDSAMGMAVGDLTRDGRSDLVVAHSGWQAISVRAQQADASLGAYQLIEANGIVPAIDGVAIADLSGDGKPDIVSVVYQGLVLLIQK